MKKLSKKSIDNLITTIATRHLANVQISIMDIGTIYNRARAAYANGQDIEPAIVQAIADLRCN